MRKVSNMMSVSHILRQNLVEHYYVTTTNLVLNANGFQFLLFNVLGVNIKHSHGRVNSFTKFLKAGYAIISQSQDYILIKAGKYTLLPFSE